MKTTNRYIVKASKIHSLRDIELEKQKLRLEIMKKEQDIHSGYRDIVSALSFRNLAGNMISEITTTSSVLSKAISVGKSLMAKRRKKKHDRLNPDTAQPEA